MIGQRPLPAEVDRMAPHWLRIFGPAAVAYLLATALMGAHFWGDSIDYAEGALSGRQFWDFGHLFWRPLSRILLPLFPAQAFGFSGERVRALLPLLLICWLSGLGSLLLFRALLNEVGIRPRSADLATLFFLLSQTFLNYAQTASSYVPGLFCLLLGCFLLARAARRPETAAGMAAASGAAWAGALGFWFPYVWALPAAALLPPLLGGFDRVRLRLTLWATMACGLVAVLMNLIALAAQGIGTVGGALAWVKASQHDIHGINGVPRMLFGLARSFIDLGEDGTLYRRYLGGDSLNPVALTEVLRNVWPIGLFYVVAAGLAIALVRSGAGRRLLALLAVAAVPILAFGIAWQGGDMERYLPLYPFLFLAFAALFDDRQAPRLCKGLAVAFFTVMVIRNASVLIRPVLQQRQQELVARANVLLPRLRPCSRVFTINDEAAKLRRNYPLNPLGHRLPLRPILEPGVTRTAEWQPLLRRRMRETWQQGGDVWVTRRILRSTPRSEWLWVEDQRSELRWAQLHEFFKDFDKVESVGGEDGYVRLATPADPLLAVQLVELASVLR